MEETSVHCTVGGAGGGEVRYIQNKEIILKSGKLLENYNDKLFIIDNFDCCSFYCARGILSRK